MTPSPQRLQGIRGATTVERNDAAEILAATDELLRALIEANELQPDDIVSALFTVTRDLDAAFPARAAEEYGWAHGLTLAEASERTGQDPIAFSLDLLVASRLEVNAVMAVRHPRPIEELGRILSHPRHVGGSDGIFVGSHPHPRGYGTFARFLRRYTREEGFYDWPTAAVHLASGPAELFGFADRGRLAPGSVADVVVVDPDAVSDNATYEDPRALATGIEDVFVRGVQVLAGGALTGAHPGRGLRRTKVNTA